MKPHNIGALIFMGPERGDNREVQTFTCGHCQQVGMVGTHDGGLCMCCSNLLCQKNECHDACVPFQKKLEDSYRRERNFQHLGV